MISKKLLELLVGENVIVDTVIIDEQSHEVIYKTAVPVENGIVFETKRKNIFELAFNDCIKFVESKGFDLYPIDCGEQYTISNYGDPLNDRPTFELKKDVNYRSCRLVFLVCEWFIASPYFKAS